VNVLSKRSGATPQLHCCQYKLALEQPLPHMTTGYGHNRYVLLEAQITAIFAMDITSNYKAWSLIYKQSQGAAKKMARITYPYDVDIFIY